MMFGVGAASVADAGWECLRSGSWRRARELFESSIRQEATPEAFEGLAWACFWLVDVDVLFHARAEAYRLFHARGDAYGAARAAMWSGSEHLEFKGDASVANGWFRRAKRLLASADPAPEHGWLALHEGEAALLGDNDTTRSKELAVAASELGRRFGSVELEAVGMALEGLALVTEGRVPAGMSLLDEAAVTALAGTFGELWAIAWTSCYVIYACERAQDFDRAGQWCDEVAEVSRRLRIDFAWALCRAHHAGVLVRQGDWRDAEAELRAAERQLERQRPPWIAEARVRLAELRRRQGRFDEAAELFGQVEGHPLAAGGMAELALDRGVPSRARRLAERVLRTVPAPARTERAPSLQVLVRSNAALGDLDAAGRALAELTALADAVGTVPLRASAAWCAGVLHAARGELDAARQRFEDAMDQFQRSGAPYESARARLDLADTLAALGTAVDAAEQRHLATDVLRRLGVTESARLRDRDAAHHPPLTARERQVLGLVAQGMSDRRMAHVLAVSEHTVHRHVSNILTKLGCSSRSAAVARGIALEMIDPLRA